MGTVSNCFWFLTLEYIGQWNRGPECECPAEDVMDLVHFSGSVVSDSLRPMDSSPPGSSVHGDSPGKNTGLGCHALLQGDILKPGIKPRDQTQVSHTIGGFFII